MNIDIVNTIDDIAFSTWQHLLSDNQQPFIQYSFLQALEHSKSVTSDHGWTPNHAIFRDGTDNIIGIIPSYIKHHSYGEYIFDHMLADSYHHLGLQYYPKLLSAIPFTPITGTRIIARQEYWYNILNTWKDYGASSGFSGIHFNYIDDELVKITEKSNFLTRHHHQYHWLNQDYKDFNDFLSHLSSRKRKNIKKERQYILNQHVYHDAITGDDLTATIWDSFYILYKSTYDRKWGAPYLTRQFFDIITQTMKDNIILIIGKYDGQIISAALNFIDDKVIYGRNWGCHIRLKNLHFETCYYQAIEFAIRHQLEKVEAGTQGEHKIQRGYVPVSCYSAHFLYHSQMQQAYAKYLEKEHQHYNHMKEYLDNMLPFKHKKI